LEAECHPSESHSTCIQFAPDDDRDAYPYFYAWPVEKIIREARSWWDTSGSDEPTNYSVEYDGYLDWQIPQCEVWCRRQMFRAMDTQFMYGLGCTIADKPEIQLMKHIADPIRAELQVHTLGLPTDIYGKLFVLKIALLPVHTTPGEDLTFSRRAQGPKDVVVRWFTCFAGTCLSELHDKILGPVMGWCGGQYHAYKFVLPSNGACFGPEQSSAIDMMHTASLHMLPASEYRLCQLLQNPEDRLVYVYDLGDQWKHTITLEQVVRPGATVDIPKQQDGATYWQKTVTSGSADSHPRSRTQKLTVHGVQLLAGQLNCPPENSFGCDNQDKGCYWELLPPATAAHAAQHQLLSSNMKAAQSSMNWETFSISEPLEFDLASHQARLAKAFDGHASVGADPAAQMPVIAPSGWGGDAADHAVGSHPLRRTLYDIPMGTGSVVRATASAISKLVPMARGGAVEGWQRYVTPISRAPASDEDDNPYRKNPAAMLMTMRPKSLAQV
jgi:hypothetical protein